ncbi:MAG: exopolysaccharide biosynthesis protein [Desulfarculus sp.]|nr:exopolysaccharide biosynthesis protein [Desulfarculus sp.]
MGKMTDLMKRSAPGAPGGAATEARQPPATPQAPPPRRSGPEVRYEPLGDDYYDEQDQERLVSLYAPGSPEAKRIDILRSQLLFPFHGEPPRTIMIASAAPREGRSLLTANLAVSFARGMQQFVMVLDCHLTDPVMHNLLQVPRQPGLTDFLEQDLPVPDIIHRTPVDKLTVIPAGSPSQRSAEILATDKMAGLLTELRARYKDRYIILDTPPVQAFDDPAVLARMVEGIVYVVLCGETDRELALRGLRALPEEKIVGVVMNDMLGAVSDATAVGGSTEMEA